MPAQSMIMPAVSPDGKQIALVRAQKDRNQRVSAQVILMDLDTGSIHESIPVALGVFDAQTEYVPSTILGVTEWSPKKDHLLISSVPPLLDNDKEDFPDLVSYDVKAGTLMPLRGLASTFFDRPLNGSIAGDGSGFLAFSVGDRKKFHKSESREAKIMYAKLLETLVFVDWTGHCHQFPMSGETREALTQGFADHGSGPLGAWCFKLDSNLQGSWEGPVATLPLSRGVVRIDCARHTIGYLPDPRVSDEFDRSKREKVSMSRQLAQGEVVVEGIQVGQQQRKDPATSIAGPFRIELWMPKMRTRRTLVESARCVVLAPAPDNKKLAIRYWLASDTERILVIDDQGATLADFAIETAAAYSPAKSPEPAPAREVEVDFAELARAERAKADAERFAKALAADPWLRDDLEAAHRYFGACSNLRAGFDGPSLDETERAKLRRQALDSIKADLALRKRQVESGTAEARAKVQRILDFWKVDRELVGVREPDSLARLPVSEQVEWRALWAEAAALETKVHGGGR